MVVFKEKVYIGGGNALSDRERQKVIVCSLGCEHDKLLQYSYKYFSMAVLNNQLVLVGGQDLQTNKRTNKLGVWNEESKTWTHQLPPMTTACCSPSVATHNNRWLVVIGGTGDGGTTLSRVEILDTESEKWYHAAPLPQPCSCSSLVTIDNTCYLVGGYTTRARASKKVFGVNLDCLIREAVSQPASASAPPTPSPWQTLPDTPMEFSTALAINGALLTIGGCAYPVSKAIYHYQPSGRSWIKVGELPIDLFHCGCTVLPSGEVFVAGGGSKGVKWHTIGRSIILSRIYIEAVYCSQCIAT